MLIRPGGAPSSTPAVGAVAGVLASVPVRADPRRAAPTGGGLVLLCASPARRWATSCSALPGRSPSCSSRGSSTRIRSGANVATAQAYVADVTSGGGAGEGDGHHRRRLRARLHPRAGDRRVPRGALGERGHRVLRGGAGGAQLGARPVPRSRSRVRRAWRRGRRGRCGRSPMRSPCRWWGWRCCCSSPSPPRSRRWRAPSRCSSSTGISPAAARALEAATPEVIREASLKSGHVFVVVGIVSAAGAGRADRPAPRPVRRGEPGHRRGGAAGPRTCGRARGAERSAGCSSPCRCSPPGRGWSSPASRRSCRSPRPPTGRAR